VDRLAPPEACGEALCVWRAGELRFAFVRAEEGFADACVAGAVVIARSAAPEGFTDRCRLTALMDAPDITHLGGAAIYATADGVRIDRAWPTHLRRPWTVRAAADQE
jgi:hypothetical protein